MGCQSASSFLSSDSGYRANNRLDQAMGICEKKRMSVREVNVEVLLSSCTIIVTRLADKS